MPHTASNDKLQVLTNAICLQRRREVAEDCGGRGTSGVEEMPLRDSKTLNHACKNIPSSTWRKQFQINQSWQY
jgi:hypothetical protein